ncbi:MAG: serine/threonine-protein kinase [Polyangiaceae bacterium]
MATSKYRILGHLASGGEAHVYLGVNDSTGERVVVKRNRPGRLANHALDALGARLSQHENFAGVLAKGADGEGSYVVQEHVDGITLHDLLRAARAATEDVPIRVAMAIAHGMAAGLDQLHGAGWVHCDVAPSNAMIAKTGRVVLLDLSSAQCVGAPSHAWAHDSFLAPERDGGTRATPAADIYSLGVVLYFLLTGSSDSVSGVYDPFDVRDDVPADLCDLVLRCTADEPSTRPKARAVCSTLERLGIPSRRFVARYVGSFFGATPRRTEPKQDRGPRVRGAVLGAALATLRARHGDEECEAVLAAAGSATQRALRGHVSPLDWYPARWLVGLTRAAESRFGSGAVAWLGRGIAQSTLGPRGLFEVFVGAGLQHGPHRFLSASASIFQLYCDGGQWQVDEALPGFARCRLRGAAQLPAELRATFLAFLEQGLLMCGGSEPHMSANEDGADLLVSILWNQEVAA